MPLPCEADDESELRILRREWFTYQLFRLQRPQRTNSVHIEMNPEDAATNEISTRHAEEREAFVALMLQVTPELSSSRWHGLLARLLFALHDDIGFFTQVA